MRRLAVLVLLSALAAVPVLGTAAAAAAGVASGQGRVAVVGVPGLRWSDLSERGTPNLWRLVGESAVASMSTRAVPPPDRGVTCPVQGWLTVSAGQRAGAPGRGCSPAPAPRGTTVPGWAELAAHQDTTGFDARIGTLGQLVADAGGKVLAIGPGAALGVADSSGKVTAYASSPADVADLRQYSLVALEAGDLAEAWLARPRDELGFPRDLPAEERRAAVTRADQRVGALLGKLPPDTAVLVAGVSDTGVNAQLHVAMARGGPYRPGYLTATSTRQDGLVTITDLTATALELLGLEPPATIVGRAWANGGGAAGVGQTVSGLADQNLASQVLRDVRGPFFAVFVTLQLLFYVTAAAIFRRRSRAVAGSEPAASTPAGSVGGAVPAQAAGDETGAREIRPESVPVRGRRAQAAQDTWTRGARTEVTGTGRPQAGGGGPEATPAAENPAAGAGTSGGAGTPGGGTAGRAEAGGSGAAVSRVLAAVQVVAVVSGSIAVATFLAQLAPWWNLPAPMIGVIATILAFAGLITAIAFAGPWRSHVLGPLTVVAGVTSLALLIDVMTGSSLQVNAVTGYEPVTGGRFYGFSNIAFAVYSTGTILALAGAAQWLLRRGVSRVLVVLACAAYGLLAVFADGWPAWGADFGGVPPFVVGLAVFLILLSGRRVSIVKLIVVGLAGALVIGSLAFADWLRPATQRTHLGTFVQQILDGSALTVIGRKFSAMIGVTVGNWSLTLLSLVALAFLFLVLDRPSRWGASALGQAYALAPPLRAGLFGALTCALIGFLVNDSGIAIPAMALTVAVPLALAASVRALQLAAPPDALPSSPTRRATPEP
ncbi:hypothetical protein [Thermoactinospora rubra]|uniref:hypothetical protein n=1 Tax=Thermoactinospora rubra TaxID=1088767 RepID=UPI00198248A2|nr:hypothetical protein [Thermoactinospora rubra]